MENNFFTLITNTSENHLNFIFAFPLIAKYLLNLPNFTETFGFNGVALCLLLPNYLHALCEIFYGLITIF